jgi:hypothetical protein
MTYLLYIFHSGKPFRRTHEICSHLPHPIQLSKAERGDKAAMFSHLQLEDFKTTNIDYLLNEGRLKEATEILIAISTKLEEAYHQEQLLLGLTISQNPSQTHPTDLSKSQP